jgi:hypothetical protein
MDYDRIRHRWSGCGPSLHEAIIEVFREFEEGRRHFRALVLNSTMDVNAEPEEVHREDGDKYVKEVVLK